MASLTAASGRVTWRGLTDGKTITAPTARKTCTSGYCARCGRRTPRVERVPCAPGPTRSRRVCVCTSSGTAREWEVACGLRPRKTCGRNRTGRFDGERKGQTGGESAGGDLSAVRQQHGRDVPGQRGSDQRENREAVAWFCRQGGRFTLATGCTGAAVVPYLARVGATPGSSCATVRASLTRGRAGCCGRRSCPFEA
ncbi:hypothetical protein C7438_1778 [Brockia lithotrophica]|uniref:Uncharacterized protein n=1 Tax=Brockia lithotrophica TaxID=933949 RepID=A0A660KUK4_9BACL|nr:hypothetical protein C7438_1778 [Brockia lithotrophica]